MVMAASSGNELAIFNNRYQLLSEIGQGGLAEVYRAQDVALGRLVAVKALRREYVTDPAFLVRFHREAQNAARLVHPNIVAVYDFGQDQERPYIVMEYVPGRDLRALLEEAGPLSVKQAVDICIQVCAGVGYAHRVGLVHGDLKPGNVLITPEEQVKVVDFGLARALGESAMDEEGELVWGTPAYFAPEQASGGQVVAATDVYAIGVILYEMLTGQLPFVGSDLEVARKHLLETPTPVDQLNPRIPEKLAHIVERALQKRPDDRFATADEMGRALIAFRQWAEEATTGYEPTVVHTLSPVAAHAPASGAAIDSAAARGRVGIDWFAVAIGGLVVAALVGLVPLWAAVYRTYLQPAALAAPTATATVPPGQVRVPDVVGMQVEAAQQLLESMGLRLAEAGWAPHPDIPAFAIVEQNAPAGAVVPVGAQINVTVSRGPDLVEVPELIGKSLGQAQAEARARNLLVETRQVWSEQPLGTVVQQDPPAGSLVQSRSLVVLMISSGTQVLVGARLGDSIVLVSYTLPRLNFRPGEEVPLTLVWQALQPPGQSYAVGLYLTRPDGSRLVRRSVTPVNGERPTNTWTPGVPITDQHQLPIPLNAPPGEYYLRVALLKGAERLVINDAGQAESVDGELLLTAIQVNP